MEEQEPELMDDPELVKERRRQLADAYITLLKSPYLDSRWKAAEALGDHGDESAVEPLLAALNDPYVDVQWLAAKSLGKLGDPRAVGSLIEALRSQENGSGSALHGAGEKFVIHVRSSH